MTVTRSGERSGARRASRRADPSRTSSPPPAAGPGPAWTAGALFAASLIARALFGYATPDRTWPYSALFKGDAALWLDYARALQRGQAFELGLPIHPPGTAYLLAWLWDGTAAGVPWLRAVWTASGALSVVALWAAARRSFGPHVALLAGVICAASHGLIVLSNSLNSETPYLLLVAASLLLIEDLRPQPRPWALALWGATNGLACLFRVEHALAFGLTLLWLARGWAASDAQRHTAAGRMGLVLLAFLAPLVPWHVHAWRAIARFNSQPAAADGPEAIALAGVEHRTAHLRWEPEALRARDALPAFARRTAADFVAATVLHRGGDRVGAADLRILEQAFGAAPRPLSRFPFVSGYGPLNFALANGPAAEGGFSRRALEEPPPLTGGAGRYPPDLVGGLPPPDLSFVYPPHVRLFNDGYAVGGQWIAAHPLRFLRLAARKLRLFWSGAALGLGGLNLPLGASGLRRAVDVTVPEPGAAEAAWQLAVLTLCGLGLRAAWRRPALVPWLLFLASKLLTALLFFGYARLGVTAAPVVALLIATALERRARAHEHLLPRLAVVLLAGSLGVEALRFARHPSLRIDGWIVGNADPFPADLHRDQRVELR